MPHLMREHETEPEQNFDYIQIESICYGLIKTTQVKVATKSF